ncbi:unnamed protein product, partial [Mycena citricolor]
TSSCPTNPHGLSAPHRCRSRPGPRENSCCNFSSWGGSSPRYVSRFACAARLIRCRACADDGGVPSESD